MIKVYVAGLYSKNRDGEKADVVQLFRNIGKGKSAAAELFYLDYAPFCPWLDSSFAEILCFDDIKVEQFYNTSEEWLKVSDILLVISGEGLGTGVDKEIELAKELDIPIVYDIDELITYKKSLFEIDGMNHESLAHNYRFLGADTEYFTPGIVQDFFIKKFKKMGGMTSEISKKIGW